MTKRIILGLILTAAASLTALAQTDILSIIEASKAREKAAVDAASKPAAAEAETEEEALSLETLFTDGLVNAEGKKFELAALKNKIVGLYFSAKWCGPCRRCRERRHVPAERSRGARGVHPAAGRCGPCAAPAR